jgi:1-pyrroline-5-carboxylate dehydrogenase
MTNAIAHVPVPRNEPVRTYAPGSGERESLKKKLDELTHQQIEIAPIIGGKSKRTGRIAETRAPHDHHLLLATSHRAGPEELAEAARTALEARGEWATAPWEDRAAVFLRAAELLAGPWRDTLNAATMLGQSKNAHQAEIDAAAELIDFWRFNVSYTRQLYELQPESSPGSWNRTEYRPLEGFVLAVTPFNFTSIAGNLPTAPALLGNTVVWKPASSAVYSAHFLMELLSEAGLPPGVINLVPSGGPEVMENLVRHPNLAGLHFTGGTGTFNHLWKTVATNLDSYRTYPRMVGETGGKDFVFAHASAEIGPLVTALVRGAFEYQGQKCSAASRAYIPENLWPKVRQGLVDQVARISMGDVRDFRNFMNAVIDKRAFDRIMGFIGRLRDSDGVELITGGEGDDRLGYFIQPTTARVRDPKAETMREEIFGPVLSIYVYPESEFEETLRLCDSTSPYGLTGAIFATDRRAIRRADHLLADAAGNFYINDKPTGAVVGQQPFGGARGSGTNDKAGSLLNLIRWVSARSIKESFRPWS